MLCLFDWCMKVSYCMYVLNYSRMQYMTHTEVMENIYCHNMRTGYADCFMFNGILDNMYVCINEKEYSSVRIQFAVCKI